MRVRMTLEEKGLDWTSHHLDLRKKENISDDYFGINPNGLVPVMGDNFTLADISWIPVHFVLFGCGYPFENYPNINRWAKAFNERESFKKGVLEWCADFSKV